MFISCHFLVPNSFHHHNHNLFLISHGEMISSALKKHLICPLQPVRLGLQQRGLIEAALTPLVTVMNGYMVR